MAMFKKYPLHLSDGKLHGFTCIYGYNSPASIQIDEFDLIPMLNVKDLIVEEG